MSSSYLTKASASPTLNSKGTWSCWFKRNKLGTSQTLFSGGTNVNVQSGTKDMRIFISSSDYLEFYQDDYNVTGNNTVRFNNMALRDVSAWYHLVVAVDTGQSVDADKVKYYINGTQLTATLISLTESFTNIYFNTSGLYQLIGTYNYDVSVNTYDGLMASAYFIDGQALTASSFGETDATTGIWKPKAYTGSYGTNGFFLKFENSGSLGTDSSGNGNNFTVNGTPTQTVDTPSNVFCTLNPLIPISSAPTFSCGNLRAESSTANWRQSGSTLGISTGKWYWEAKGVSGADWNGGIGIKKSSIASQSENYNYPTGYNDGAYGYFMGGNEYYNGSSSTSGFTSYAVTDVVGIALDLTNNFIYYHKNGTWQNSGVPTSGATGTGGRAVTSGETWLPFVTTHAGGFDMNFGNGRFGTTAISSPYSDGAGLGKFQYQPPTGYYALCTKNINVYG